MEVDIHSNYQNDDINAINDLINNNIEDNKFKELNPIITKDKSKKPSRKTNDKKTNQVNKSNQKSKISVISQNENIDNQILNNEKINKISHDPTTNTYSKSNSNSTVALAVYTPTPILSNDGICSDKVLGVNSILTNGNLDNNIDKIIPNSCHQENGKINRKDKENLQNANNNLNENNNKKGDKKGDRIKRSYVRKDKTIENQKNNQPQSNENQKTNLVEKTPRSKSKSCKSDKVLD